MERLSDEVLGRAVIKVTGACPLNVLNMCAARNIDFWDVQAADELTIYFRTRLGSESGVLALADRCCCDIEVVDRGGAPVKIRRIRARPVLAVLSIALCAALIISSFFVWDIEITGNETVSDTEILNALEESGVYLGAFCPSICGELVRSRALLLIPELKWLGVSVFGSRVVVQVREATEKPELFDSDAAVKIVASRAGIIEKIEALCGAAAFESGQTAVKGETLIDAVVPGLFGGARIVHAKGSVFARTWYEITAVMPLGYEEKVYSGTVRRQYAVIAGKHRINFFSSSRIFGADCDIIIEESQAGIKGLFSLPLTLVCEKVLPYETVFRYYSEEEIKTALDAALERELLISIGENGEVAESTVVYSSSGEYAVATLRAECVQDIAVDRELTQEEIDSANADGEDEDSE